MLNGLDMKHQDVGMQGETLNAPKPHPRKHKASLSVCVYVCLSLPLSLCVYLSFPFSAEASTDSPPLRPFLCVLNILINISDTDETRHCSSPNLTIRKLPLYQKIYLSYKNILFKE